MSKLVSTARKTAPALRLNTLAELSILHEAIVTCNRCERLREYCQNLGVVKRAAYRDQEYWAKPVPGFGDVRARIHILGLAPGAHGANRTGRPFTGDGAGYFMYQVLHEFGLANQQQGTHRGDGLKLRSTWISSVVRCAPPADKPSPDEVRTCSTHLGAEIALLRDVRVVLCLGKIAWDGYLAYALRTGIVRRRSSFIFEHEAQYQLPSGKILLGSYHPSLRNTNTGRLNSAMFGRVIAKAIELSTKPAEAFSPNEIGPRVRYVNKSWCACHDKTCYSRHPSFSVEGRKSSHRRPEDMAYVIAEPCIGTKDRACVDACPVDCIHPKADEAGADTLDQLFIDPVECIDCGACVPVCPVSAIYAGDDLPDKWVDFREKNAAHFGR